MAGVVAAVVAGIVYLLLAFTSLLDTLGINHL